MNITGDLTSVILIEFIALILLATVFASVRTVDQATVAVVTMFGKCQRVMNPAVLVFSMWTETIRDSAKEGKGNTIFLDGNIGTMEEAVRRLQGIMKSEKPSS